MYRALKSGLIAGVTVWMLLGSGSAIAMNPSTPETENGLKIASELKALDRLNGSWKLDWNQSDSFKPAMQALEVPWVVRQMAGIVSVQLTIEVTPAECETCEPSLHIRTTNPIKDTERIVVLDGIPRPFTDVMGNGSMDQFSWDPELGMEMVRERVLDSGKAAKIRERRTVSDDLSTMISTMTVWIEGEERASLRRILLKVDP